MLKLKCCSKHNITVLPLIEPPLPNENIEPPRLLVEEIRRRMSGINK